MFIVTEYAALTCNCINGFIGVLNGKAEQPARTRTANGAHKRLVLHLGLGCGSMSITTPVSFLAIEFVVRSVLHGQVTLLYVTNSVVLHHLSESNVQFCMTDSAF